MSGRPLPALIYTRKDLSIDDLTAGQYWITPFSGFVKSQSAFFQRLIELEFPESVRSPHFPFSKYERSSELKVERWVGAYRVVSRLSFGPLDLSLGVNQLSVVHIGEREFVNPKCVFVFMSRDAHIAVSQVKSFFKRVVNKTRIRRTNFPLQGDIPGIYPELRDWSARFGCVAASIAAYTYNRASALIKGLTREEYLTAVTRSAFNELDHMVNFNKGLNIQIGSDSVLSITFTRSEEGISILEGKNRSVYAELGFLGNLNHAVVSVGGRIAYDPLGLLTGYHLPTVARSYDAHVDVVENVSVQYEIVRNPVGEPTGVAAAPVMEYKRGLLSLFGINRVVMGADGSVRGIFLKDGAVHAINGSASEVLESLGLSAIFDGGQQ